MCVVTKFKNNPILLNKINLAALLGSLPIFSKYKFEKYEQLLEYLNYLQLKTVLNGLLLRFIGWRWKWPIFTELNDYHLKYHLM